MSILGGIGWGNRGVPKAPTAENRELENGQTSSSIIKSAKWGRSRAGISDPVSIVVELNKKPRNATATIQIFFNSAGAKPHPFDTPFNVSITGPIVTGTWQTKAPKMRQWTNGFYTFRVWVDSDMLTSDNLQLSDDPVARVVRRISTDGFDR